MNKEREGNWDLLRIISCIAVILIHSSEPFYIGLRDSSIFGTIYSQNQMFVVLVNTITRISVPLFVMLSGAFLLNDERNKDRKYFYKKTIKNIVIPVAVFSIIFFVYSEVKQLAEFILIERNYSLFLEPIKSLLIGAPFYHMWYMYMIIGIYFLIPDIIVFYEKIKNKKSIVLLLFLYFAISGLFSDIKINYSIAKSILYIGYLLIGAYIKEKQTSKNLKKGLLYCSVSLLFLIVLSCVLNKNVGLETNNACDYIFGIGSFNPFIVISSISAFIGFSYFKMNGNYKNLSKLTFYIYLIHPIFIEIINFSNKYIIKNRLNNIIIIVFGTVITFILSIISSKLYIKLYNAIDKNNKIENKIYNKLKL